MRLLSAIPKLASMNIERSLEFYSQLGFARLASYPDYGIIERDGVQIHLWLCADPEIPRATGCRINVENLAALHTLYSPLGVIHPHGTLETKPWGWREFSILDLDGNLLTFAERAD